jgi:methylglyoxal synthase
MWVMKLEFQTKLHAVQFISTPICLSFINCALLESRLLPIGQFLHIPIANNRASADFMISSPLTQEVYAWRISIYESKLGDSTVEFPKEED